MTATTRPRRRAAETSAVESADSRALAGSTAILPLDRGVVADVIVSDPSPGVTPERPMVWHLFFPARPAIAPELRGHTKSGKLKKSPPRLPPNINERRNMHPIAESRLIEFWRGSVVREVRRQHAMRLLDRARISAVIYRRNQGVADASGDSERLKPLVDGLVEAGVLKNDRRRDVEYGEVREDRIGYRGMGVLLIVEAQDGAATEAG